MAIIRTLSLLWIAALWGCSSSQSPVPLAERYQQLAVQDNYSVHAMRGIASEAYQQGDLQLMSQAQWQLCQRAVALNAGIQDCAALLDLAIIRQDKLAEARAYLAHYFITQDKAYYEQAMTALPASEGYYYNALFEPSIQACLDGKDANEWQAMQCYLAGKAAGNEAALQKALTLFSRYQARHNMADSYFVLAKILLGKKNPDGAADYASKAALLLSQLGEKDKAQQVRNWRQDHVYAQ